MEGLGNRCHVVADDNRAQDSGDVKNLAGRGLQICIGHWCVGRPEVNRLSLNLFDAAARSDRLIINADVGIKFSILTQPFLVQRIWKRSAGALKMDCATVCLGSVWATGAARRQGESK